MDALTPSSGAGPAPGGGLVARTLPLLTGLAVGIALGVLVRRTLPGLAAWTPWVLLGAGLVGAAAARLAGPRGTDSLAASGSALAPSRAPVVRDGPLARAVVGAVVGLLAVWAAGRGGSFPVVPLLLLLVAVPVYASVRLIGTARARQRLEAGQVPYPDAAVVLATLTDVGAAAVARWASSAGTPVPVRAGLTFLLLGGARELEWRGLNDGEVLHRWRWRHVELSSAPDPVRADRAVLVITLHGPGAPRERGLARAPRERFDVALRVSDDSLSSSTPAVVAGAITTLSAAAEREQST